MNCWKVQFITHDNWGSIYPAWNQSRRDLERWIIKLWNPQDTVTDLLIEICCTGKCIQLATGTAILYKFTCSIWACKHLIATLRTSSMLKCICTPKPACIHLTTSVAVPDLLWIFFFSYLIHVNALCVLLKHNLINSWLLNFQEIHGYHSPSNTSSMKFALVLLNPWKLRTIKIGTHKFKFFPSLVN